MAVRQKETRARATASAEAGRARAPSEHPPSRMVRLIDYLLSSRPLGAREMALATLAFLVLGGLAFGSHVINGGFIMDDWSNAAKTRYLASCCGPGVTGGGAGYRAIATSMLQDGPAGYHLGLPLLVPFAHFLFGVSTSLHLALSVTLGALMSAAFYAVLRHFRLAPLHAGLIAALVLVFPFSDSTRLWAMAGYNQLAVILYLVGLLLAFAGLRQRSRPRALALHAGALLLYACGTLIYEIVGGAVVVAVGFYLLRRASWRAALARWLADCVTAGVALWTAVEYALPRGILPWAERVDHARLIADHALTLGASVIMPFGTPNRYVVAGVLLLVVAVALWRWRALPTANALRSALGHWLVVAAVALAGVGVGYLLIVPAPYGSPLDLGIENRVNMLSALGWAALAYAIFMLVGLLAVERAGRPLRWAAIAPVALALFLGVGYLDRLGNSKAAYARSFDEQLQVLTGLATNGPYREGSTIYTFGHPTYTAPGVPVFTWFWDLNPAAKIQLADPSLATFPMLPDTEIKCGRTSLYPVNAFAFGKGQTGRYGLTYFVDTETGAKERIQDRGDCRLARLRFAPGPLKRGSQCRLVGGGPATRVGWQCPPGEPIP